MGFLLFSDEFLAHELMGNPEFQIDVADAGVTELFVKADGGIAGVKGEGLYAGTPKLRLGLLYQAAPETGRLACR